VTRWGFLADIHGNLPALERALAAFRERGVERIAVLGDNLGRGDADGCVRVVRAVADVSVVGNRDLDWQHRVAPDSAAYVLGLPHVAQVDGIAFSHGDARLTRELATDDIRTGFRRARGWLAENACGVWAFGHSHRARLWTVAVTGAVPVLRFDGACDGLPARIDLSDHANVPGACTIINAGSVGLPFGGKGPASATVYDSGARTVEFFCI
jgi:predicted phosphodiesterase